jgi:DNA-binding GntR family transcriptional regulator
MADKQLSGLGSGIIERTTLSETIHGRLRKAILNGDLAGGQELNQVRLAEQFGVSRLPVRDALLRLRAENLVTVTPHQVYVVGRIEPDRVLELLEVRAVLEPFAVLRHLSEISAEDLAEVRALNGQMREEQGSDEWLEQDRRLHAVLCGATTESSALLEQIRTRVQRNLKSIATNESRRQRACDEHEAVITAVESREAAAVEQALWTHIESTRAFLMETMSKAAEPDGPAVP